MHPSKSYIDITIRENAEGASIDASDDLIIKIDDFGANIQNNIDFNSCNDSGTNVCNKLQSYIVNNNLISINIFEDFEKGDEFILTLEIDDFESVSYPSSFEIDASGNDYFSDATDYKLRVGSLSMPNGNSYYITDESDYQDVFIVDQNDFHIQGVGEAVIETNDLFTMNFGNGILFSEDIFDQLHQSHPKF